MNETINKDLGLVTAYAYAVAGGYTGTEEEFKQLMADLVDEVERLEDLSVTVTTLPEGSPATASLNGSVLSLGIPKGDTGAKGDTGNGIASIAKTSTSGLVDTYTITFTNGTTTTFTVTNGAKGDKGDPGDVSQAQLDAAVSDLKSEIDKLAIEQDFSVTWESGYIRPNGSIGSEAAYCVTNLIISNGFKYTADVANGYKMTVGHYDSHDNFIDFLWTPSITGSRSFVIPKGDKFRIQISIESGTLSPSDITDSIYNANYATYTDITLSTFGKAADAEATGDAIKEASTITSGNVLDTDNLAHGYTITSQGVLSENALYATTDFIEVEEGNIIVGTINIDTPLLFSRVVTYDKSKVRISGSTTDVTSFTVPSGCSYVRIALQDEYVSKSNARLNLKGTRERYEPFYSGRTKDVAQRSGTKINNLLNYPLTTLPNYILKNLAYRPLGVLTKGYICFTSDDGNAEDETYTIPMFISKGVPCTLALFKNSAILQSESGLALVQNAVSQHGFCVAQHGGTYWQTYSEDDLQTFFDSEEEYWESIGITPQGAVNPGTDTIDWIRAMAGGRFNSFRTDYYAGTPYYDSYINGARSNINSLTSQNIVDLTLEQWKTKCDKTLSNHWLMMIHFHGNQTNVTTQALIEAVIDYAKSINLEFITQADIPTLK